MEGCPIKKTWFRTILFEIHLESFPKRVLHIVMMVVEQNCAKPGFLIAKNIKGTVFWTPCNIWMFWLHETLLDCIANITLRKVFLDDCQLSRWFWNCPDFSRWFSIFRTVSKVFRFFQIISCFPDSFKTLWSFPDDLIIQTVVKLSG